MGFGMNKAEQIILRYEKARQLVRSLEQNRIKLACACHYIDGSTGQPCALEAFDCAVNDDEVHDYEEAFYHVIRDEEGACPICIESRRIKKEDLAKAKQELGNAKRQLSYLGKRLIKDEQ